MVRCGGHVLGDHGWELAGDGTSVPSPSSYSMSNKKAELLEAAAAAGVEADESMTKAEILGVLEA